MMTHILLHRWIETSSSQISTIQSSMIALSSSLLSVSQILNFFNDFCHNIRCHPKLLLSSSNMSLLWATKVVSIKLLSLISTMSSSLSDLLSSLMRSRSTMINKKRYMMPKKYKLVHKLYKIFLLRSKKKVI